MLGEAATLTFQQLIGGSLPNPIEVSKDMGPLVDDRRLMMWSADAAEQSLLTDNHLTGAMPQLAGENGWAMTLTNAAGNKIDSFLDRSATFAASTDAAGITTSTLHVDLTNEAPSDGLPRYIIGNRVGLADGTSRLYVSFYSATPLTSLTVDGVATGVSLGAEDGWYVASLYVDLAPGQARSFDVSWQGQLADPGQVLTWTQPMANPLQTS